MTGYAPHGYNPPASADTGSLLAYVDFLPACLSAGGVFSSPKYERFDVLIKRANEWLSQNPNVKATDCESLETKLVHGGIIDTDRSTYLERSQGAIYYVRSLRIWIVNKSGQDNPAPQSLGYYNVIPACIDAGGFLSHPKFQPFNEVMASVNQLFRQQPLPGTIINLETQDMKFHSWTGSVDPDESCWVEYGNQTTFFLNVIRIFYEGGPPAMEEIGCADFVPAMTAAGGFLSPSSYEPLSGCMEKANQWIMQQSGINIVNIQSVDYKVSHGWGGEHIDTMRSLFYEPGKRSIAYLRILRVCFTRTFSSTPYNRRPEVITYRTFKPGQISAGGMMTSPTFEGMRANMNRLSAWIRATGARVRSAETVTVRLFSGFQYGDPEITYTYNNANRPEQILYVLRVFLDGVYQDPPMEALPALPVMQDDSSDCCQIL